jgi:dihydropteroate synthase
MRPDELESWLGSPARRPLLMGILNVTPDSFSDGGRFVAPEAALAHARQLVAEGADWIDVGGESTRPGSVAVPEAEQVARVEPVVREVARLGVVVSVDTTRAAVAGAALDAGAAIVNDISAGRDDPALLPLVAARRCPVVLMHMQGTPATMQVDPRYDDVVAEVTAFLRQRVGAAVAAGVEPHRVLIDPGIGFGKTLEHNLRLMRSLADLATLGPPLLVGTSRKGFIGAVTGVRDPLARSFGNAAAVAWSLTNRAAVVRVHEVEAMRQVVRMTRAMQLGRADEAI